METTTFAALLAAGGVAIGVAWGGLLANFAAGAFLVFLRPFKVGDFVNVGGVTGTVEAVGLFGTTLNTPDNVMTIVGNNKVFSDTIQNFSANPYRRVDLTATINHAVDHRVAIRLLKERLAQIPNVLTTPAPDVEILQFTPAGPLLCVRPYCSNQHYWQVYFDTNRVIRESFGEAGFPAPVPGYAVTGVSASPAVGHDGELIALAMYPSAHVNAGDKVLSLHSPCQNFSVPATLNLTRGGALAILVDARPSQELDDDVHEWNRIPHQIDRCPLGLRWSAFPG